MSTCQQAIIQKLEDRIAILKEHSGPTQKQYENPYAEVMDAVSRVVGTALCKELEDLLSFVRDCGGKCE